MDVNLTRQTLEAEKTLGAEEAQVLPQLSRLIRRVRALPSLPSSAWVTQTQ